MGDLGTSRTPTPKREHKKQSILEVGVFPDSTLYNIHTMEV